MSNSAYQRKTLLQEFNKYSLVEADIYNPANKEYEVEENDASNENEFDLTIRNSYQDFLGLYNSNNKDLKTFFHRITIVPRTYIKDKSIALSYIQEAISEARVLLKYEFDWNENEGEPTNEKTFNRAADFLLKYANAIAAIGLILPTPYIDLMPDGSISVKWETLGAEFFIIFRKENIEHAYFYGESKDKELPTKIKGGIKNSAEPDDMLLAWMKNYLVI